MIKNIAYYPLQAALNSGPILNAFLDSCQSKGIQPQENSMTSDAAVIWSVLWNGRMAQNESVYWHYRQQNKPVIIIEIGALYRGTTWKISVNHVTSDGFYGHTTNLDWDRPRKLGISLAYPVSTEPHILIASQHRSSLQLAGINIEEWINDTVNELKNYTDRPVYIRPHPRCKLNTDKLPLGAIYEIPKKLSNTYDSFDMHYNCHAVINYNSGPGIQTAISGVRPMVNKSSLAWPVSISISDIEKPYTIDRERWLTEICHTEYTLDEIKQGTWLKRISPAL